MYSRVHGDCTPTRVWHTQEYVLPGYSKLRRSRLGPSLECLVTTVTMDSIVQKLHRVRGGSYTGARVFLASLRRTCRTASPYPTESNHLRLGFTKERYIHCRFNFLFSSRIYTFHVLKIIIFISKLSFMCFHSSKNVCSFFLMRRKYWLSIFVVCHSRSSSSFHCIMLARRFTAFIMPC